MLKEIAGTRAYNILKKRKMETVEDVCQLFPSKYYDFSFINPLNTSRLDKNYAFVCKLVSYELKKQSSIYIVRCTLQDIYTQNELCVSWFGTTEMYNVLKKDYRPGDTCFIGGKLKASNKKNLFFMSNPIIFKKYDGESDCHIYTAYEKIRGISESNFERIINDCLEHATIPDKVPRELLHKYNLMSKDEAIREMHKPSSVEGVKKAKYRLNIDDLLYFALQLEEKKRNLPAGSVYGIHSLAITTKIIKNLPFQLTKDQKSAYEELVNRIRSGKRLNALIQGDVGCGKTILAFLLMFVMADNIENMEKFEASKMGVLKQFVEDVRTYLRDYIEINFETMEEMMSHDKKWEKYSIKVKENKSKVYEKEAAKRLSSHKIEIVDECNTETSKKIAVDFQAFLKKVYGVGSKLGDSVSSGTYNLRIIHNKDYYKGINDLHDEIFNKCIVQHITVENYKKCDLEKNPEFYAIIQELFIKEDIVNKQLTTFNWSETLGKSGKTWAFVSFKKDDTDKNTKKKDQYTYYRVFIAPDGKLSFDSCAGRSWMRRKDEWKNIIGYHQELIDRRKSEKRYDENIEGFFYTDINDICTIYKTNACVYPRFDGIGGELLLLKADKELDKEQMIDALLHFKEDSPELVKKNKEDFEKFLNNLKNKEEEYVDKKAFYKDIGRGKLREGFNEYLRAEYRILLNFSKSKENLPLYDLDAMTDIHYSISGDSSGELVKYFVGSAKALNGSVARSNPIRKIIGKTLKAEEILPMLTATFVRNEQYTVIPFPYKYIREYFQVS